MKIGLTTPIKSGLNIQRLNDYLQKIVNLDPKDFYVIYTDRGTPHPLKTQDEKGLEAQDFLQKRMQALKDAGLKMGVVAGSYVKPSEGENFEYYASADKTYEGDWAAKRKAYSPEDST